MSLSRRVQLMENFFLQRVQLRDKNSLNFLSIAYHLHNGCLISPKTEFTVSDCSHLWSLLGHFSLL